MSYCSCSIDSLGGIDIKKTTASSPFKNRHLVESVVMLKFVQQPVERSVIPNLFRDPLHVKINLMPEKKGFVYILTNRQNSVFYIGVTSKLTKRIWEHQNKLVAGFSKKYNLVKLIYYEVIDDIELAIKREKQLKNWHRDWKINLIKRKNPQLKDLSDEILN